nr:alcohol dehydrogenase [Candidatus Pantoea persica]
MALSPEKAGLKPQYILQAVEASLRRLQTDYIDLYQAHRDDEETPLAESLAAFDSLIKEGKVRAIGASNYSAPRLHEALAISEAHAAWRAMRRCSPSTTSTTAQAMRRRWSRWRCSTGWASLTTIRWRAAFSAANIAAQRMPARARGQGVVEKYLNPRGLAILASLDEIAHAHGVTPTQVEDLVGAMRLRLAPEEFEKLAQASA